MKTTPLAPGIIPKKVKDFISVIQNADDLFELYMANIQLENLKIALSEKKGKNPDDDEITAEINLASHLQDLCRRRV